jgi:1-deoxy-D-xylulose-5-phosphate reductoisomerase
LKKLAVLGSTGSIGTQALELVRRFADRFQISVLTAGSNAALLEKQAREFKPSVYGLSKDISVTADILSSSDIVLIAVSGIAALPYIMEAVKAGKRIALANKEALVAAGGIIMEGAKKYGAEIIPVDSEHSAIFQCVQGQRRADLKRIVLTASGGPLLDTPQSELENIKPERVVKHPRWNMGKKISVDSATMMNKGLEVIEAHHLFGLSYKQIDVVIHPQSVIHSMAEFIDGSVLAQMSNPDMTIPIGLALFYPERCPDTRVKPLDFNTLKSLDFKPLNTKQFPCFELAMKAFKAGGIMPCVMNAANEAAVDLFLREKIPFLKIPEVISNAMAGPISACRLGINNLCDIMNIDREVKEYINKKYS